MEKKKRVKREKQGKKRKGREGKGREGKGREGRKGKKESTDRNRFPSTIARTGTSCYSRAWKPLTPTYVVTTSREKTHGQNARRWKAQSTQARTATIQSASLRGEHRTIKNTHQFVLKVSAGSCHRVMMCSVLVSLVAWKKQSLLS